MKTYYDITVLMGKESINYPQNTPYKRYDKMKISNGDLCNLSSMEISVHAGTHIDSPAHFIDGGKRISQFSIENFILPARVINVENPVCVTPDLLDSLEIDEGTALLFRTANSINRLCASGKFSEEYVYISSEAAQICVQKKASLVGLDYISIEEFGNNSFPAHHSILGAGIPVLEGIDLKNVPAGSYTLHCLPLKMDKAEASPTRAVLFQDRESL